MDPIRLLLEADSDAERLLLRAARLSAPSGAKERALAVATGALVASAVVVGGAAASSSVTAGVGKAGAVGLLKWFAVLGVTGMGAMGVAVYSETRRQTAPEPGPIPSQYSTIERGRIAPRPPRTTATAAPIEQLLPLVAPATETPRSATATSARDAPRAAEAPTTSTAAQPELTSAPSASTLNAELAALDDVRATMGDPPRALSLLDAYATRYPRASMAQEAALLRIEALVKAGDRAAAMRLAQGFLADPHSAYAARVRSILGMSNP